MSWITGVGLTNFGRHEGQSSLDLMTTAAAAALTDSGLVRKDIDGLVCGYSTTIFMSWPSLPVRTQSRASFTIG